MDLGTAVASSFSAGISMYGVIALLGIAGRLEWIDGDSVLEQPLVIGLALVLFAVEFVVDKIALLDTVWDGIHTVLRPMAGALILSVAPEQALPVPVALGVGAGLALVSHSAKSSTRLLVNASPEPVSNVLVSTAGGGRHGNSLAGDRSTASPDWPMLSGVGLFKNLKQGLAGAMTPPTPEQMDAILAQMPPDKRAEVEANRAKANQGTADAQAIFEEERERRIGTRVLDGPAGEYLDGRIEDIEGPQDVARRMQEEGAGSVWKGMLSDVAADLKEGARQFRTGGKVEEVTDPEARARVSAEHRAARDAARAPYLAAGVPPIAISRLTTRGATQIEEVAAYLQHSGLADHPERVYGVYRVPDRISPTLSTTSERGRVVEWDVVHEPGADTGPAAAEVDDAWFPADEQWVARRLGEQSVLDEDLGLAYCIRAGLPPERCLGIARHGEFVDPYHGEDTSPYVYTYVTGVHVFHPSGAGGETLAAMVAEAPLPVPDGDPPGAHTAVLNVGEIERAVHPRPQDPTPVPSPFPYLPAHPQELLRMYLEVVGVRATDCYSAQVTVSSVAALTGRILEEGVTNMGPRQPCADGRDRGRIHGAEHIVVTYRDGPAYAEGRARWATYQEVVLQAHLERGIATRRPVENLFGTTSDSSLIRAGATLLRGAERISTLGDRKPPPPYRYCSPPVM